MTSASPPVTTPANAPAVGTDPRLSSTPGAPAVPEFKQVIGHPAPLWMLFMTEFWERFAFYGMRWALTLYIVAQFFQGNAAGQGFASRTYGAYLALVYASAIFGGYVADRVIGYQRSILVGAVFMAAGLFMVAVPDQTVFMMGLAAVVVGNGLFKPNISTMVGKLYTQSDTRRDAGFTLFYMGINAGALLAPFLTGLLAEKVFGSESMPAYKAVFIASAIGMLVSTLWFFVGRGQLKGIGAPPEGGAGMGRLLAVMGGGAAAIPVIYFLLVQVGAAKLQIVLSVLFLGLCAMLLVEGVKNGRVARDKTIAMLIIFTFNVLFWMFFEQAGSSFNFLAAEIVRRDLFGSFVFPIGWFQSINPIAVVTLAPLAAMIWLGLGRRNADPSIPRKFGLGLLFNGLAFLLLMFALTRLVGADNKIPFWTLFSVYVIQTVGELCLSPIGLSMVTKLAPTRLVGLGMGGWFLSTGIGNNLSGIFASEASGESGMTTASALAAYTNGFWTLMIAGAVLFLIAPLVQKLMHGVK
jgi:POT family proton-dependent oligopeptide transporter